MTAADLFEVLQKWVVELKPPEEQELYSPKEVGKAVGREASTVRDWIRMERVRSVKRGRNVFIDAKELERLKQSHCELLPANPNKVPPSLKPKLCPSQSVAR